MSRVGIGGARVVGIDLGRRFHQRTILDVRGLQSVERGGAQLAVEQVVEREVGGQVLGARRRRRRRRERVRGGRRRQRQRLPAGTEQMAALC